MRIEHREIIGTAAKYAKVKGRVFKGYWDEKLDRFIVMDPTFDLDGETVPTASVSATKQITVNEYASKLKAQLATEAADRKKGVVGKVTVRA